jgi:hypothetical protein
MAESARIIPQDPVEVIKADRLRKKYQKRQSYMKVDELTVDATPIDWSGMTSPGAIVTVGELDSL